MPRPAPVCFALLLVLILMAGAAACSDSAGDVHSGPAKIAVLGFFSGPGAFGWEPAVEWALDSVNNAGGAGGREVEPLYLDPQETPDVDEVLSVLFDDPDVVGAVGMFVWPFAPRFIREQKPYFSPMSTTADIFRAFASDGYIWRTVESDTAQTRLLLREAKAQGAQTVALLTGLDPYGTTFFDWFGFFAEEIGLETTHVVRFDHFNEACDGYIDSAVQSNPDLLVVVPRKIEVALCAVNHIRTQGLTTQILFADAGYDDALVEGLGAADAEGLAGLLPSYDPASGFAEAYTERFGSAPPAYAGNTYDAIMLLAYGLQRSGGKGGEALELSMREVVDGRGEAVSWDKAGIARGLDLIDDIAAGGAMPDGAMPDISGTTGALTYDSEFYTDPIGTYFAYWEVHDGEFKIIKYESSATAAEQTFSAARTAASKESEQTLATGTGAAATTLQGAWAVVIATSGGWPNYRHQADALAQYRMLKNNGFTDDRIIFIMKDDIAANESNALPSVVRNAALGPNIYQDVVVDYPGAGNTPADIVAIITNDMSRDLTRLPVAVESTENDNVYIFIVGHGGHQGVFVDVDAASYETTDDRLLTPKMLGDAIASMAAASPRQYRRMFIAIESCHSGVMGEYLAEVAPPNVVLMAAATPVEQSLAANYDRELNAWVADQFAFNLLTLLETTPDLSVRDFYSTIYGRVSGSHVRVYNAGEFGDVSAITLEEFVTTPH